MRKRDQNNESVSDNTKYSIQNLLPASFSPFISYNIKVKIKLTQLLKYTQTILSSYAKALYSD